MKPLITQLSRLLIIVLAVSMIGGIARAQDNGGFPRTVTDGAGNKITINARPTRILSGTLSTDEILFSLVDPSRLIAITSYAANPDVSNVVAQSKQVKTQLASVDPETVINLKPDIVFVASYTDAGVVKQLQDAKLTVFTLSNFTTIKDIESNITLIGQAVGEESNAAKVVGDMESRLKAISTAVSGVKPLTALYYGPDGYSDGAKTTIDDVITHAGGINAVTAGGIKDPFPQLNDEFVVTQDPDVILLAGYNSYSPGFVDKFNSNPNFQTLKAIKNKHVYVANDADVASVSQYIVDGVSDVAALLYPDAYQPPATPSATMSATESVTANATETATMGATMAATAAR